MFVRFKSKIMDTVAFFSMVVIIHGVYSCDPVTQYEQDGECCRKCGPGTRMQFKSDCKDPLCTPCSESEYQPTFTRLTKCELQPYCDPNKNFDVPTNRNKTSLSPCRCKMGYHCSTSECLTCAQHTKCRPGQWIAFRGDHIQDTVCQACPANTFSSVSSVKECQPWTICDSGSITETKGTPTSDIVCVPAPSSGAFIALVVSGVVLLVLLAGFFILWKLNGTFRGAINKAKESCLRCFGEKAGNKGGDVERAVEQLEPMIPDTEPPSPQHPVPQTPVEDEDSQAVFYTKPQDVTENGHVVAQEEGKADHMSVSDSQMSVTMSA
ncbi:hypothetical protein UPYG_G00002180 [Umbra pygmaea]|uniref:TNFR-Cys domain-containing protein n=1 Tax=Umbra pygmaea TaxID=75934 RepID=A0ABD0XXX8_UMBPY